MRRMIRPELMRRLRYSPNHRSPANRAQIRILTRLCYNPPRYLLDNRPVVYAPDCLLGGLGKGTSSASRVVVGCMRDISPYVVYITDISSPARVQAFCEHKRACKSGQSIISTRTGNTTHRRAACGFRVSRYYHMIRRGRVCLSDNPTTTHLHWDFIHA